MSALEEEVGTGQAEPDDRFRSELRGWLGEHLTAEVRHAVINRESDTAFAILRQWNAGLYDAGYAAVGWPAVHGGRDASLLDQLAFNEEMARAGAPGPVNAIGVANIAPAIMALGTDEQQVRFLRPLLRGDKIWSQGMSEPDAGSDLAALRTRAVLDGDHFVVDGQKTWNSMGHRADWCQLYVRTDPDAPRHRGITCLLVDMRTPGIHAKPIVTMAGGTDFSEVFFDAVRVPVSSVLGEVNGGWQVATSTLGYERAGVASLYLSLRAKCDRLLAAARKPRADGTSAWDDPVKRDRLMVRYIQVRNLELLAKRTLGSALRSAAPGPEGSVIKLAWSTTDQALQRTAVDVLGMEALDGPWAEGLLGSCSLTIAGGTTEVNKNIIGERVLGLPREPKP
jgi:alkylation response protein AidB-like acyl-CoA dehydrogenase